MENLTGNSTHSVSHWVTESVEYSCEIFSLSKLSIKEQAIIAWFTSYKRCVSIWRQTMVSDHRIGSNFFSWLRVCLLYIPYFQTTCPTCTWARACAFLWIFFPQKTKKNTFFPIFSIKDQVFKVEFLWVPTTESAQFFFGGSVCVSSTWLTTCHVPCARL